MQNIRYFVFFCANLGKIDYLHIRSFIIPALQMCWKDLAARDYGSYSPIYLGASRLKRTNLQCDSHCLRWEKDTWFCNLCKFQYVSGLKSEKFLLPMRFGNSFYMRILGRSNLYMP